MPVRSCPSAQLFSIEQILRASLYAHYQCMCSVPVVADYLCRTPHSTLDCGSAVQCSGGIDSGSTLSLAQPNLTSAC
jgi:hypothetical protein